MRGWDIRHLQHRGSHVPTPFSTDTGLSPAFPPQRCGNFQPQWGNWSRSQPIYPFPALGQYVSPLSHWRAGCTQRVERKAGKRRQKWGFQEETVFCSSGERWGVSGQGNACTNTDLCSIALRHWGYSTATSSRWPQALRYAQTAR